MNVPPRNRASQPQRSRGLLPPYGLFLPLILFCLTACGGCVDTGPKRVQQDEMEFEKAPPAEVAANAKAAASWQEEFIIMAGEAENLEVAYGLFSAGGWADAGQIMVISDSQGAIVHGVAPGADKVSLTRELSEAEWRQFKTKLKALEPLQGAEAQSFDGLVYDFVQLERGSGKPVVHRRVTYQAGVEESPEQRQLRGIFGNLIRR